MRYNIVNRTRHASGLPCATRRDFHFMRWFYEQLPKTNPVTGTAAAVLQRCRNAHSIWWSCPESLLVYGDSLVLGSPLPFRDKKIYWQNYSSVCSEIARSHDVFIRHNFHNHDGQVPLWAAVEVMSFGTLSRTIKNLKTGNGSAFARLSEFYKYQTQKGNLVKPSYKMLSSWIQALVILRNTCAHNARIYNRSFNTSPKILQADRVSPKPPHSGLYQLMLAMKYLRPSDDDWQEFFQSLDSLIQTYQPFISLSAMNFPSDWKIHLSK